LSSIALMFELIMSRNRVKIPIVTSSKSGSRRSLT
jgi:hypothetical protein